MEVKGKRPRFPGKTPAESLAINADELFDRLGLFEDLSRTRRVGVYAIVERVRAVARELEPTAH